MEEKAGSATEPYLQDILDENVPVLVADVSSRGQSHADPRRRLQTRVRKVADGNG